MNIPDFVIPSPISRIVSLLPQWPTDQMILTVANLSVRTGILPTEPLDSLEARTIGFEITDLGMSFAVTCLGRRFWRAETETAEFMIRAKAAQFLQLLTRQEDPDTLFFNRTLVVEGDTELGLTVKNLLDSIDWSTVINHPLTQFFHKHSA